MPGSTSIADGSGLCYSLTCEGQWAAASWVHVDTELLMARSADFEPADFGIR